MRPRRAERSLAVAVAMLWVSLPATASAQTDRTAETVRFLRQAWSTVRREGPKQLNSLREQWPRQIREIKRQATDLQSRWAGKLDDAGVAEKLSLIAELWRIRSSLNLLSLTSPDTIHAVTGMDTKQFEDLKKRVEAFQKTVRLY